MRISRTLALAAAGAGLAAGLAACGTPAPSAQCRAQLRQVGAYQAEARALSNSSVVVSNGSLGKFNADVGASGRLLKMMKSEGCPDGGY